MPRPMCEPCCAPTELARSVDSYRAAVLQILCAQLEELQAAAAIGGGQLLGELLGANFNSTADQPIALNISGFYTINKIIVSGASVSLTTAAGGIYQNPSKTDAIVAAGQVYTALTTPAKATTLTITALGPIPATESTIYLSLTTPQGAPATADIYVFGSKITT